MKHHASIIFCRMLAYASAMVSLTKVTDWEKMMLRLPPGMRDQIAEASAKSGRSMNAEVIARLEASFGAFDGPFTPAQQEAAEKMFKGYIAANQAEWEARFAELQGQYDSFMREVAEKREGDTPR